MLNILNKELKWQSLDAISNDWLFHLFHSIHKDTLL